MIQKLTPEQVAKLPKWAQQHIEVCYASMDELQAERTTLFDPADQDTAKVFLTMFHGANCVNEDDQPLRDYQRVKFFPGKHRGAFRQLY